MIHSLGEHAVLHTSNWITG